MSAAAHVQTQVSFRFETALRLETGIGRKGERTRAGILLAGCRLLDRISLTSLTVSEICQEAGIAHGTFYIYFADRQDFVGNLLLRFVVHLKDIMQAASKSPGNSVRNTTAAYCRLFEENPGLMRCLVNHMAEFPVCRQNFQKLNRDWCSRVANAEERRLAAQGHVGHVSRDELLRRAYALGGMVDQYLTELVLNRDRTLVRVSRDRDAMVDTLTLIWNRGMTA